jgi:hypothetical protein
MRAIGADAAGPLAIELAAGVRLALTGRADLALF